MRSRSYTFYVFIAAVLGLGLFAAVDPNPNRSVHGDGYYTWLWARTMVMDGDLDFHDDYLVCNDPWGLGDSPVGRDLNYWNLGPALFWAPILAYDVATGHPSLQSPDPIERSACLGPLAERAVHGSFLAGVLTILLGFLVARRHFGVWPAVFGALAVGLLSSLAHYSTLLLSYGHAASAFGCGVAFLLWDRYRRRGDPVAWIAMGAGLGLAMLMRTQNVVLVVLPFVSWLGRVPDSVRAGRPAVLRHVSVGVLFVLAMIVVFFPQTWFWHSVSGSWLTLSQGEHYLRWGHPRFLGALFSSSNGLFVWQPITYVALAGMIALLGQSGRRWLGVALIGIFAIDAYVVGSVYDWWGSVGFPGRRFDLMAVPLMVGAAGLARALLRADRKAPGRTAVVAALLVIVWLGGRNLGTALGVASGMRSDIPRPRHVALGEVGRFEDRAIWDNLGEPLAWPASIPFALQYGVHPRRWDLAGGRELFYHEHQTLRRLPEEAFLLFASGASNDLFDGFRAGPTVVGGEAALEIAHSSARVLLPLHHTQVGTLVLRGAATRAGGARLSVRWEGVDLGTRDVPSGAARDLEYDVPPGVPVHGLNELWLWTDHPVGLVRLELLEPDPPPMQRQLERNAQLRALQDRWRGARDAGVDAH
jgi:hypothetical protein